MAKYLVALDQGTTSSRALVFDKGGRIVSSAQKEFTQIFPQPGWVEQDPMEIWASQLAVLTEARARGNIPTAEIAALGITNQRETTIVWDRHTGEPVYNAVVWQCRRTADYCDQLTAEGWAQPIREKTGLVIDAYFSATKLRWILENVNGARARAEKGDLLFGTVDSWLLWNLSKGRHHATDYSNASRTMLFNIHDLDWDEDILHALNIPRAMLPEVCPSSHLFGYVDSEFLGSGKLSVGGIAGDQQAALFGQCCHHPGMVKNTYGTGCFLLMHTGESAVSSQNGLISTIAWGLEGKVEYALEGSVFVAGAAVQWIRDGLGLLDSARESEAVALSVPDNGGVYLAPAFVGLGAPYWDPRARGSILGLTRGSSRAHIVRATLESIAYQSYDVMKAMEQDAALPIRELRVDGGASANNFLMQFQADLLDARVLRPSMTESTALGAAYLAGLAVGFYRDREEIRQNLQADRVFAPQMQGEKREALITDWHEAVKRSRDWAK